MHAHLVQLDIVWEEPTENHARVTHLLADVKIEPGDLILLPEMFATGFSLRNEVTTAATHDTRAFIAGLARSTRAYVQGGLTVAIEASKFAENRAPIYSPSGEHIAEYAKIHPFGFGREPEAIQGGQHIVCWDWTPSAETKPLRVGIGICYDLRFPELFRSLVASGAQCFALGANWPSARQEHWRSLAIARAIENQAFMLAVNRCGSDPHLDYAGGSIAVGPRGEILGELTDAPGVLSVPIDPEEVTSWRDKFPALRDIRLPISS